MSPAGRAPGRISATLARLIGNCVADHDLGEVHGAETSFILSYDPDTVLAQDVAFVRAERLTPDLTEDGFLPLAPDLVVEIVSLSDRMSQVTDKVITYLDAGVLQIWVVEPRQRVVTVYSEGASAQVFREDDEILGDDVFPSFRLPVREIFE